MLISKHLNPLSYSRPILNSLIRSIIFIVRTCTLIQCFKTSLLKDPLWDLVCYTIIHSHSIDDIGFQPCPVPLYRTVPRARTPTNHETVPPCAIVPYCFFKLVSSTIHYAVPSWALVPYCLFDPVGHVVHATVYPPDLGLILFDPETNHPPLPPPIPLTQYIYRRMTSIHG